MDGQLKWFDDKITLLALFLFFSPISMIGFWKRQDLALEKKVTYSLIGLITLFFQTVMLWSWCFPHKALPF